MRGARIAGLLIRQARLRRDWSQDGLCLGIVTFAIRQWGSYAEGVSFALLFMNLWVPFINDWTRQTPYGYVKPAKKAKEGAGK